MYASVDTTFPHSIQCLHFDSGDELKQTVSIVVDIASVLDPDGVDVYFLNREPLFHVRNSSELVAIFAVPPSGKSSRQSSFSSRSIADDPQVLHRSFPFYVEFFVINNIRLKNENY